MSILRHVLVCLLCWSSLSALPLVQAAAADAPEHAVWVLRLEGVVGPASADYLVRGLEQAAQSGARAVVIEIDTPGGLDLSMRQMISAILAAPMPVIGYVTPVEPVRPAPVLTCCTAAMSPPCRLPPTWEPRHLSVWAPRLALNPHLNPVPSLISPQRVMPCSARSSTTP